MENFKNPVLKNVESGQIVEVVKSPFSIGRALTCDYIIESRIVSRTHCSLTKTDEGWTLTDSSTNGTLVNDGHYKGETSPILKHNDEINLGVQNYAYRFITEFEKPPNCQVEKLKNDEIYSNTAESNEVISSGRSTPYSFDENGVSDDLLNNLADSMLNNVENETSSTQPKVQADNIYEEIVYSTSKSNQESIANENSEQPSTSTHTAPNYEELDQSKASRFASHHSEAFEVTVVPPQCNTVSLVGVVGDIPGQGETRNSDAQSQTNSSVSTVIYSLPDEMSQSNCIDAQSSGMNVDQSIAQVSTDSASTADSIENASTSKPKPRDLLAESIEAVVRRFSEYTTNSSIVSASTSAEGMSSHISKMDPTPITIPTSVTLASPLNSNKKIKVMAVSPNVINQLRPVAGQVLTAYSVGAAQKTPAVRMLTNNEMQRILANQPSMPIVRLGQNLSNSAGTQAVTAGDQRVIIRYSGANTATVNSTGTPVIFASGQRVISNRGGMMPVANSFHISVNPNSANISGNSSSNIPTSNTNLLRAVRRSERINPGVPYTAGSTVLAQENSSLQCVGQQLVSAGNATGEVSGGTNTDVIEAIAVPAAEHEVVIENTVEATGDTEANSESTTKKQILPAVRCQDSQEPGTSKAAEKLETCKSKQNNQNQYEEMENELMCTICANLFIKAITLGCSHSFCQYCIEQWKKKKFDCPICRNKITSTIRTLVLDNIIEKMLENASEEDKQDRKAAVEERKKTEEAETAQKKQQESNRNNGRGRNTARRGRRNFNRGNQRNNTGNNNQPGNIVVAAPSVITVVDSPSTTDNDSDNSEYSNNSDYNYDDYYSDEWYNGRPGAYYGGYGRCYSCGEQGHWSTGCPYR